MAKPHHRNAVAAGATKPAVRKTSFPLHSAAPGCGGNRLTHLNGNIKMKNFKIVTTLISALMLTAVVGCAATRSQESTGQYVDDTVITTSVKHAILNEPTLKVNEINVETFKGVVQLSGFVRSAGDIDTAIRVARGVNGVKSVKNDMRLK